MQFIIANLTTYYKIKHIFLKEVATLSSSSKKYHPFYDREAELLHMIYILEEHDPNTINNLLLSMYSWRKRYLEYRNISKSLSVNPIEIGRSLRILEESEKEMKNTYYSWLN